MGYQIARGNAWHFYYFRYTEWIKTHFYRQNFKSFKINASWNFSYKMTSLQWSRFAVSFIPQPLLLSMKICRDNMEASRLTQYRSSHKKKNHIFQRGANVRFSDELSHHLIKIKCANSMIAFQSTHQIEKNRVYKGKTID